MVKMKRKYSVVSLAVITILFAAYQTVFIVAINLSPLGSDPLFNITLFPGIITLSAAWLYLILRTIVNRRKGGVDT